MANLKYSRQRESIKQYLTDTHSHPTADTVYLHVKKEYPNISLGTVYRNLNLLTEMGEAVKITTPDGGDRFDGHIQPHYHLFCEKCGKVVDLQVNNPERFNKIASENFDGIINDHSIIFKGICGDCTKKS